MVSDISDVIIDKEDTEPKRPQGVSTQAFFAQAEHVLYQLAEVAEDNTDIYKRSVPKDDLVRASQTMAYLRDCATIPKSNGRNAYQRSITESQNNPVPFQNIRLENSVVEEMSEEQKFNLSRMGDQASPIGVMSFDHDELKSVVEAYDFSPDYSWDA